MGDVILIKGGLNLFLFGGKNETDCGFCFGDGDAVG